MIRGNIIAALFSMCLVLPGVFFLFDRQLPLQLDYIEIVPRDVVPGQTVEIHWKAKKFRHFGPDWFDCTGTFTRRMVDASGIVYETKSLPMIAGAALVDNTEAHFTKQFTIPNMLPGVASYQITTTYYCNPVQWLFPITHRENAIHFNVLKDGQPHN